MISKLLVAAFILGSTSIATAYNVNVEGTLLAFDSKAVKLKQENGQEIFVPRTLVPRIDGYVPGKAWLRVAVPVNDLLDINPKRAAPLRRLPATTMNPHVQPPPAQKMPRR